MIIHILWINIVFLILKFPVENVSVEKRDNLMKALIILIYSQIHVIWIQVKRTGYNTLYMYLVVVFYFDLSFKTFIKISGIVGLFMSNTSDLPNLGAVYHVYM